MKVHVNFGLIFDGNIAIVDAALQIKNLNIYILTISRYWTKRVSINFLMFLNIFKKF